MEQNFLKEDMVQILVEDLGTSKAQAKRTLDKIFGQMESTLKAGGTVKIGNLGILKVAKRAGRNYINPKDKSQTIYKKESNVLKVKQTKYIKEALND